MTDKEFIEAVKDHEAQIEYLKRAINQLKAEHLRTAPFTIGDHVKIISGYHSGRVGIISDLTVRITYRNEVEFGYRLKEDKKDGSPGQRIIDAGFLYSIHNCNLEKI